jgi:hypothetical protein
MQILEGKFIFLIGGMAGDLNLEYRTGNLQQQRTSFGASRPTKSSVCSLFYHNLYFVHQKSARRFYQRALLLSGIETAKPHHVFNKGRLPGQF